MIVLPFFQPWKHNVYHLNPGSEPSPRSLALMKVKCTCTLLQYCVSTCRSILYSMNVNTHFFIVVLMEICTALYIIEFSCGRAITPSHQDFFLSKWTRGPVSKISSCGQVIITTNVWSHIVKILAFNYRHYSLKGQRHFPVLCWWCTLLCIIRFITDVHKLSITI